MTEQEDRDVEEPTRAAGFEPLSFFHASIRTVVRQLLALLGLVLIIIGVPLAIITPFPFVPIGLPVVIIGVVLLGRNSLWGRALMERILHRFPSVERFAPNWLMKLVFGRDKRAPTAETR